MSRVALLHAGHQAGQHSPLSLLEDERWSGEEEGEVVSQRCLCIINVGQIRGIYAFTGLSSPTMSPLSVRCWTHIVHKWMDKSMNCLMLSKSMVHVQSVRIMLRHHFAAFGKRFHYSYCSLSCSSEDREVVNILPRGCLNSLLCNLIPPLMHSRTDCRPAPWHRYAAYKTGCAPFPLFRIN